MDARRKHKARFCALLTKNQNPKKESTSHLLLKDTHTQNKSPFSFRNRTLRVLWNLVAFIFFRYSPIPFFNWRSFLLRCFGAKIGKKVHVYPKAIIWAPWNIYIGNEAGIASGAILYSQGKIIIGKKAVVSQGAHLVTGTHDYNKHGFPLITKPIIIQKYAWIAAEAFVLPGITIGEGCVIGARAVVTKNMPPWMVCCGNPCKPIKTRIPVKSD
jgi:putative colanic acid biosynthesis acetyltransferase WcaF